MSGVLVPAGLPLVALHEVDMATANRFLVEWGHHLGACRRPFGQQAWVLIADRSRPVSVAVSASTVSAHVVGPGGERLARREVVELARLCSAERWATRVMVRLWREEATRAWPYWPVRAAVAYSFNGRHEGRTYRFDGWTPVACGAGSSGGGTWSRPRPVGRPARGRKTLWVWYLREAR